MIEVLALVLTGLGLTASIVYYANILNNDNKTRELQLQAQQQVAETRQTQLYMQVFNMTVNNRTFIDSYFKLTAYNWKDYNDFLDSIGFRGPEITELGYTIPHDDDVGWHVLEQFVTDPILYVRRYVSYGCHGSPREPLPLSQEAALRLEASPPPHPAPEASFHREECGN